jgi:hypothetical protein
MADKVRFTLFGGTKPVQPIRGPHRGLFLPALVGTRISVPNLAWALRQPVVGVAVAKSARAGPLPFRCSP